MDPVELRAMNMVRPEQFPWVEPDRCHLRQRRLRAVPADGRRGGRLRARSPPAARVGGRWAVPRGRFLVAMWRGPATRARGSSPGAGSQFGAHESVMLRANRSGGIDLYTGVIELRPGQRDRLRPDVQRIPRHRLRRRSLSTQATRATRRSTRGRSRRGR